MAVERQEQSSLTTVEVQGQWDMLSPGFSPFQSSSLMTVERQEHPSLTTVDVHGYAIPSPPSLILIRLLRDKSTPVLRLSTCRNTLSPGLCVFHSSSLNMAVEGREYSSLATVDMQGHSVPRFSAFPVLQSCNCERQEHSSLTTVYVHGRRTTVYVQSSSLTTVVVQGHTVSQLFSSSSPAVL